MIKDKAGKVDVSFLVGLINEEEWTTLHEERVMDMCQAFGVSLNMEPDEIRDLMTVGLIHDIGKIFVPKSIVNKPGVLSPYEYEEMKRHPVHGYHLLMPTEYRHLAPSVLHHHEHFDGNGYPDGLSGEDIPLYARIVAIVDAYDAMTSHRPYAAAMSKSKALQELIDHSGKQFDPELVALFEQEIITVIPE